MSVKFTKLSVISTTLLVLVAPLCITTAVHAESGSLVCDTIHETFTTSGCDLSVDEKVSINATAKAEAQTADHAVAAKIGDTITWTITVDSDSTDDNLPDGTVVLTDTLPSQATFVGATASTGTYSKGSWTFRVADVLPATLTIVATANATGTFTNSTTLTDYTPPCYEGECIDPPYIDGDAANNTSNGYVTIPAAPVVATQTIATPTNTPVVKTVAAKAPDTGFGSSERNIWTSIVGGMLVALPLMVLRRKLRGSISKS